MKKIILICFLLIIALACLCGLQMLKGKSIEKEAVVETHIGLKGQELDAIILSTDKLDPSLKSVSFILEAEILSKKSKYRCVPRAASVDGNSIVLDFSNFPEMWGDIGWWRVFCWNLPYSFSKENMTDIHVKTADDFERHQMLDDNWKPTGESFDYSLFRPKGTDDPCPLVLVLHGMNDADILYSGVEATYWAEAEFQDRHPCYVLVPYFDEGTSISREEVLQAAMDKIQEMVDSKMVDPMRIYISGMSMGGYHGTLLLTRFYTKPVFAAALLMAPWLEYNLTADEIARAKDTPVLSIYGENDPYIPEPGEFCDRLNELGNPEALRIIYSADDFEKRGIESQHLVDQIVFENDEAAEWLFSHTLRNQE